jgi:hypothetical protein
MPSTTGVSDAMAALLRMVCATLHPHYGRRAEDRLLLADIALQKAQRGFTMTGQKDRRDRL